MATPWLNREWSGDCGNRQHPPFLVLGLNIGSMVLTALAGQAVSVVMEPRWQFHQLTWGSVQSIAALFVVYNLVNLTVMGVAVAIRGEPILPYVRHYLRYMVSLQVWTMP